MVLRDTQGGSGEHQGGCCPADSQVCVMMFDAASCELLYIWIAEYFRRDSIYEG